MKRQVTVTAVIEYDTTALTLSDAVHGFDRWVNQAGAGELPYVELIRQDVIPERLNRR